MVKFLQAKEHVEDALELPRYIETVIKRMKSKKESSAEVERMKEVAKQEEALLRLKRVMEARLRCESSADHAKGLVFDASLDDDEALLRLMHAVDSHQDRDGALSMEELLDSKQITAKQITAEMRDALDAGLAQVSAI